jgi:hypothetical protein
MILVLHPDGTVSPRPVDLVYYISSQSHATRSTGLGETVPSGCNTNIIAPLSPPVLCGGDRGAMILVLHPDGTVSPRPVDLVA